MAGPIAGLWRQSFHELGLDLKTRHGSVWYLSPDARLSSNLWSVVDPACLPSTQQVDRLLCGAVGAAASTSSDALFKGNGTGGR
ncbi:MAG: hypothetical protein H6527_00940 [Actinobacteria bacterium]|nr:hypothetical protein [Actinomycetota bacterium]